jgi:hypothetical protein
MCKRNTEARSRNHHCWGKAISITHSECLRPLLSSTQVACVVSYCNLWPLRLDRTFPHYLISGSIYGKKVIGHRMCFDFLHNICVKKSHSRKNSARRYKYAFVYMQSIRCHFQILKKLKCYRQICTRRSNINFREVSSSGSRVPCGEYDGRTDKQTWRS